MPRALEVKRVGACLKCRHNMLCITSKRDLRASHTCNSCDELMIYLHGRRVAVSDCCPRLVYNLEYHEAEDGSNRGYIRDTSDPYSYDRWISYAVRCRKRARDGSVMEDYYGILYRAVEAFCADCAVKVANKLRSELEEILHEESR